jgi:hypothetical protein
MRGLRKETVIRLQPGTVAMEGYLPFEHAVFWVKSLFPFPLASA